MLENLLEKLMVNWSDAIGAGSFGRAFLGTWLGTDAAVKQIRVSPPRSHNPQHVAAP